MKNLIAELSEGLKYLIMKQDIHFNCMVNQTKKSRSFVCNQNRNMSQKKCIKLSQVKILDRNWRRDGKQEVRIK